MKYRYASLRTATPLLLTVRSTVARQSEFQPENNVNN